MTRTGTVMLVVVEDDDEDFRLTERALEKAGSSANLRRVRDGRELLVLLRDRSEAPRGRTLDPVVVLLDLNMPRMDGREALAELKGDPRLRSIPVVILSSTAEQEEIRRAYELGVCSFLRKPAGLQEFVALVQSFSRFWLESAELPGG